MNGGWGISSEIALRWMPLDLTNDKSTLVQVMAWCRQATSHYLSQCWPRSMSPNGVTRPQWVNYTLRNEVRGGYIGFTLSVCPSVCLLPFRVRPVASTVQDGFFPYLVQMINSMRGCVACDDLWPWPISSRSLGLDLENCVRSVAFTVLDGFFLYPPQRS